MYTSTVYATTLCLYSPFRMYEDKKKINKNNLCLSGILLLVWEFCALPLRFCSSCGAAQWHGQGGCRRGYKEPDERQVHGASVGAAVRKQSFPPNSFKPYARLVIGMFSPGEKQIYLGERPVEREQCGSSGGPQHPQLSAGCCLGPRAVVR